jgi:glycosyltransferase involved in cell wall biosynthesis
MKILLLMDPFIPVPPIHYGGIERIIHDIAVQYVKMGHQVTIVAGPNSQSPDRLITYGKNGKVSAAINLSNLKQVYNVLKHEVGKHDVVHNFGRLAYLLPFIKNDIRKVQSYLRHVTHRNIKIADAWGSNNLVYTACSDAIKHMGQTRSSTWHTVYNCTPIQQFTFQPKTSPDSYLAFVGRFERCKGLHNAIKVAKTTGRQLIIAGYISEISVEKKYFEREIKPLIDGEQIKWIGTVDNAQRNELLGNAAALITPVEWEEPFPVILPEAYACGTPVLAFGMGGIPEGIEHGVTGYISNTVNEMVADVGRIAELSRAACRIKAESFYSDEKIANDYLSIYKL